jgi:hypothetical protein
MKDSVKCRDCKTDTLGAAQCNKCHSLTLDKWVADKEIECGLPPFVVEVTKEKPKLTKK